MTPICRRRDERGAFLLVFALCLTILLTLVAFAVDLGQGRFARRDNQQLADIAALDAGRQLAGYGAPADETVERNPYGACVAAINSVQTNADDFRPVLSTSEIATACASFYNPYGPPGGTACSSTSGPTPFAPIERGPYELTVLYPVPDSVIKDQRFDGDDMAVSDGNDPCERMQIRIERTDQTSFAGVIGVDEIRTSARAVISGGPDPNDSGVAALVLLEREGCNVLATAGQGTVRVKSPGEKNPGTITADSAGSRPPCANQTNNRFGWVIYGTALPQNEGGGPSIIVDPSPDGAPGSVATYAGSVGGREGCCYPDGITIQDFSLVDEPTSRLPADERYNPANPDPPRETISSRHSSGYAASVTNGAALPVGALQTDCNPGLNPGIVTATSIVVHCPEGLTVSGPLTFPEATTVKFIGSVNVANGGLLALPKASTITIARPTPSTNGRLTVSTGGTADFGAAQRIDIGGTPTTCTQVTNCSAMQISGTIRVNHGGLGDCSTNRPGYNTVAAFGGVASITGAVQLCETTVFVARDTPTYAPVQRPTCDSFGTPCPVLSETDTRDRFLLSGGGSTVAWTAPDQSDAPPNASSPFESLALWVEGSGLSEIKGQGELATTGVFFLPNANFDLGGTGSGDNPENAQFFSRRLYFSGQGVLELRPDPKDAVPTPIPGVVSLIR